MTFLWTSGIKGFTVTYYSKNNHSKEIIKKSPKNKCSNNSGQISGISPSIFSFKQNCKRQQSQNLNDSSSAISNVILQQVPHISVFSKQANIYSKLKSYL